jgi:hypothetical protein
MENQFQPVTDSSVPSGIEIGNVALKSYVMTPASKLKLTNPEEVQEAIRILKVSKAPCTKGIPKMTMKHLSKRAVSILV